MSTYGGWKMAFRRPAPSDTKDKDACGFTLLEIMLAMAILAIALVTVFQSQSQCISMANESRFATTASLLARGKMAEIEAMGIGDINSESGDFGDDFPDYFWRVDVAQTEIEYIKKRATRSAELRQ
jgi:general secretion pathway protein I